MAKIDIGEALLGAVVAAVRPYVRRMMARGVTFGRLEKRLRDLFVEVAESELGSPGSKQTDSRISVLTGINRKEVRRIRAADGERPAPTSFMRSLAASVVSRWMADPRATTSAGRPLPIPYDEARGPSFVKLAAKTTVDLGPRALLQVLIEAGAAELRAGNVVALTRTAYVPERGRPEALAMLADDPPELIETMLHNVLGEGEGTRLQQKLAYDNLGSEGMERLRAALRREAIRFLDRANKVLLRHDRDRNARAAAGERTHAGIGIYYFERQTEQGTLPSKSEERESRKRGKRP